MTASSIAQTGLPIVEVKRIEFPDYLDSSDLLERKGNQLVPSDTARWGERLSIGMGRVLTSSLAARLPRVLVTATQPVKQPAQQILVDVSAFGPTQGSEVILVAQWSIQGMGRQVLDAQQTSLIIPIAGTGDAAVVAAMSGAVEELAAQISGAIERTLPMSRVAKS